MPDIYTEDEVRALMQAHSRASQGDAQANPITRAVEQGSRALGYQEFDRGRDADPLRIPKPAVATVGIDLSRQIDLGVSGDVLHLLGITTASVDHDHSIAPLPVTNVKAGETIKLDPMAVISAHSMAARAGAFVFAPSPNVAPGYSTPGQLGGVTQNTLLARVVDWANFSAVSDGADVPASGKPVLDALFSHSDMPHYGFRVQVTRKDHRDLGGALLEAEITAAVLKGIGILADSLVMSAIDAATPTPFTFAKLAARNAGLSDVQAICGTTGAPVVWQDGTLRTSQGVRAMLTAGHAKSFIGRFDRAFVCVYPNVSIHAKRLTVDGTLDITCLVSAKAVLPSAAQDFWSV